MQDVSELFLTTGRFLLSLLHSDGWKREPGTLQGQTAVLYECPWTQRWTATVAVETQIFVDLSLIESENGSSLEPLHHIINDKQTAFLPIRRRDLRDWVI